jgi:methylmalonyl-CoA mutase
MRTLFSGIPLDRMSVSMTMNGAVLPVLALYIVAAEQGVLPPENTGTIGTTSSGVHGPQPTSTADALDPDHLRHFAYTSRVPRFNSISISGYHMQGGGSDGPRGSPIRSPRRRIRAGGPLRRPHHRPVRARSRSSGRSG